MGATGRFPKEAGASLLQPFNAEGTSALCDASRQLRFELASRGDCVPGRLRLPADAVEGAPAPLLLFADDTGACEAAARPVADAWLRAGAAVASIDLPLHGRRANPKLTPGVRAAFQIDRHEAAPASLWSDFVHQAVADLRRALDTFAAVPELDASRTVYVACGVGALVGAVFCARDARPRAAALALGAGGFGPREVDPACHIGGFAPRPLLLLNARHDERTPRRAARALHEAAGEPKQIVWFDACHGSDLPEDVWKEIWVFLREPLGLLA